MLDRISRRFRVNFKPIQMGTPSGELPQTGHVHVVKSQAGLLGFLAIQTPQIYLVFLTLFLAAGDIALRLGLISNWNVGDLSVDSWLSEFLARLSSGAFGAYLVALFIKYGEVRNNLRGSARKGIRAKIPGGAYGAYIEWKTE
jgi:hypothetical protein